MDADRKILAAMNVAGSAEHYSKRQIRESELRDLLYPLGATDVLDALSQKRLLIAPDPDPCLIVSATGEALLCRRFDEELLTDKQLRTLLYIYTVKELTGKSPSHTRIGDYLGITNAQKHVNLLVAKGMISKGCWGEHRSLSVTQAGMDCLRRELEGRNK